MNLSAWIKAMRLRTLPLALSTVGLGSFLAASYYTFKWDIFTFTITTTILLQVLSNFANDYGDFIKGTDNEERLGPERAMQGGLISNSAMKKGIIACSVLTFASGITLLYLSFENLFDLQFLIFLFLGLASIAAAIKYTVGKSAYGYRALGDLFVFVFFGILGVVGSFYLQAGFIDWKLFLPAISIGCFSTGVLNLNNMRDRESDLKSNKITLAVLLGENKALIYHTILIVLGVFTSLLYTLINHSDIISYYWLIVLPLFIFHLIRTLKAKKPLDFDPELKKLALSTFAYSIVFGISLIS